MTMSNDNNNNINNNSSDNNMKDNEVTIIVLNPSTKG